MRGWGMHSQDDVGGGNVHSDKFSDEIGFGQVALNPEFCCLGFRDESDSYKFA